MKIDKMFRKGKKALGEFTQISLFLMFLMQASIIIIPYIKDYLKTNGYPTCWMNIILGLHLLLGLLSFFVASKIKTFVSATNINEIEYKHNKLLKKSIAQNDMIKRLVEHSIAIQWSLAVLDSLRNSEHTVENHENDLENLLAPLIQKRARIFNYRGDDFYNIAVYLYNQEENYLEVCFRDCDNRIVKTNRKWTPPHGHIGYAYDQNIIIIKGNYPQEQSTITTLEAEHDKEYYASFIAAPIQGDDGNPIGVFVITSSRPGQFKEDDKELYVLIINYTLMLSQYFNGCCNE